ncbi:26S proteasome regulatory subunit rpn6 [Gurleya vavrai]
MSFENIQKTLSNPSIAPEEKEILIYGYTSTITNNQTIEFLKDLPINWKDISMARTTKIVRKILNNKKEINDHFEFLNLLINLYKDKKLFNLELQASKTEILLLTKNYSECLESITFLVKELKKHDDKVNLIKLFVCESKAFYELKNVNRARSSLTTARAMAVTTFCPNEVQAQIDMLSGMYICDEKNYETAFGYFLEALDGYLLEKSDESLKIARYLILCKIIGEKYSEVNVFLRRFEERLLKLNLNVSKDEIMEILVSVNNCCIERDLNKYNKILNEKENLLNDDFIKKHLHALYDKLLESNIKKIVEPYKNIAVNYICECLSLNVIIVEDKLRKMILDSKIKGILDHVKGCLIVFDEKEGKKRIFSDELVDEFTNLVQKIK